MTIGDVPLLSDPDERALVAQLTRQVLAQAAPEEIKTFETHESRFLDGKAVTGEDGHEDQLGFGVEVIGLLTPYVVAAATAAIRLIAAALAEAAGAEAKAGVGTWLRRLLHGKDKPAPLSPDLLRRVREATFEVCRQMGADNDDAVLVSEAVAGRLGTA